MKTSTLFRSIVICAFATRLQHVALADDLAAKGRDVFGKNSHAVITVEVVAKSSMQGQTARDEKLTVSGTVMDSSGLTVMALSSCDPSSLWHRLNPEYKMEVEVTDLKMMLEDGSEIPAEIVLRDKDLDLAFIRPKVKQTNAIPSVDFKQSGTVDVLDDVIGLNRSTRPAA